MREDIVQIVTDEVVEKVISLVKDDISTISIVRK